MMKATDKIIWRSGINRVTTSFIHMRRRTVAMSNIDLVEISRPYLTPGIVIASGFSLLAFRFSDVMTWVEIAFVAGVGWGAVATALMLAELRLHSYSLKDLSIMMPVWRARAMRTAIDQVLVRRQKDQFSPESKK